MNLQPLLNNSDTIFPENLLKNTNCKIKELSNTSQKIQQNSDDVISKPINKSYSLSKRVSCPVNLTFPTKKKKLAKQNTNKLELQSIEEEKQKKNEKGNKKKPKQIINNQQFFFVFNNLIFQNNEFSSNFRKTSKYRDTFHKNEESKSKTESQSSKKFTPSKLWGRLTKKQTEPVQITGKMKVDPNDLITINSQTQISDKLNYESFSEESLDEIYDHALLDEEYDIEYLLNDNLDENENEKEKEAEITCFQKQNFFEFNSALQLEYLKQNFEKKKEHEEEEKQNNSPNLQIQNPLANSLKNIYSVVNYNLYGSINQQK